MVQDLLFAIKNLDSSLLSNVVKTHNTIRNTSSLDHSDPADLSSIISVSTTASFSINTIDVDNAKRVSWNNTTLVKTKTVLKLSLSLIHESLINSNTLINDSVGHVLDFDFFILSDTAVVGDIKMSLFRSFLGTSLPNVRSKYSSASSKHNVSTSVMGLQLLASSCINFTLYRFSLKLFI